MKPHCLLLVFASMLASSAEAHHGVAGLGAAALEGPGAPVESATSAVLPDDGTLLAMKVNHARFRTCDPETVEADYSRFVLLGLGRGFTPWFSGYVFLPHNTKVDEPGGYSTRGFADVSLLGQIGFRHDGKSFSPVPKSESLDELEDWHFTVFGGATLPTGKANLRLPDGSIDPGMSTGFGKPSYSLGLTATRMLSANLTVNAELSALWFRTYRYAADPASEEQFTARFGAEQRMNAGLAYRFLLRPDDKLRADFSVELQHLHIARDARNGVPELATGGRIVYALPGLRVYRDRWSFAFGVKRPVWKRLNEQAEQQGAEGLESYRLIFSASALF